jgi:uncharacterized membrane protein
MTDHSHSDLAHQGDPGLDRLLFFSDGVFAIAITLLSIELHPPHDWDGSAGMLWREGWPMLASFALSFLVIGIFWNAHRRLFRQMVRFTQGVFFLNLLLLAGIALMPFATSLIWRPSQHGDGFLLYIGLVSMIGLTQGLTYAYAAFAADAMRPRLHWLRRLSLALTQALMPSVACGLSLAITFAALGQGSILLIIALAVVMAGLIGFMRHTGRRYPA